MSTTFIAVQCYQCSTMQVKKQKKSSNKWICAICNERQSVRQVFARGSLARDVRKFVQSFNLARQNLEQETTLLPNAIPPGAREDSPDHSGNFQRPKRTDWTEYLDCERGEEEGKGFLEVGLESEIEVVTELPKQLRKPVFGKRKGRENHEPNKFPNQMARQAAKCRDYPDKGNQISKRERETPDWNKYQKVVEKQPSKWCKYLETEENEMFERETDSCNPYSTRDGNDVLHGEVHDQRVEEDIHPDFM